MAQAVWRRQKWTSSGLTYGAKVMLFIGPPPVPVHWQSERKQAHARERLQRTLDERVDNECGCAGNEEHGNDRVAPRAIGTRPVRHLRAQSEQRESGSDAKENRREHDVREQLLVRAGERQDRRPNGQAYDREMRRPIARVDPAGGGKERAVGSHREEQAGAGQNRGGVAAKRRENYRERDERGAGRTDQRGSGALRDSRDAFHLVDPKRVEIRDVDDEVYRREHEGAAHERAWYVL